MSTELTSPFPDIITLLIVLVVLASSLRSSFKLAAAWCCIAAVFPFYIAAPTCPVLQQKPQLLLKAPHITKQKAESREQHKKQRDRE